MMKSKTVAIIGAGACGLVCAKVLLDDGFDVTLFDRQKELGGIWSAETAYANLHTQQPGGTFEFSDLYNGKEFAPWQSVHDYLQKYADVFHITERIQFQTRVLSIDKDDIKNDTIPWIIKTETIDGLNKTHEFNFVVIASGLFSEPYLPNYPGQDKFAGSIVPPSAIKSQKQLENKRVIVIGAGKCATDMAVLAGHHARSCHLVFRRAHWMIPRKIVGGVIPVRVLYSRAFTVSFSPIPGAPYSSLFRFLHEKFPSIFTMMTNIIQNDILSVHGSDLTDDKIFIPQHSFRHIENASIIPVDFIPLKREGRIIGRLAAIEEILDETTIRLDSGEELQADMIISATGFIRRFSFFSEKHTQMMGLSSPSNPNIELNLYRRILPVGIPNIAFIGFTSSISYWIIAEAACHWISDYFLKRLELTDSEEEMYEEIQTHRRFMQTTFNRVDSDYRYYWAAPLDIYLNDMGVALHRTSNWISEYFGVYRPERLRGLHDERRINAKNKYQSQRFYFSFELNVFLILFLIFIYLFFFK